MSSRAKILLGVVMTLSLLCGFLHEIWPNAPLSFKRLHIFGFNLLTGGSLILYHIVGKGVFTPRLMAYFAFALLYALFAAAGWYIPALLLSIPLFLLVESVRIERFSLFPVDFFRRAPVSEKFDQASLLCLSIGIVFASLVILNNEYLRLIHYEKLTIEVFFLGYSFPVSLITMAIMFSFMTEREHRLLAVLKELSFWLVNLGVIVFFALIIFDLTIPVIAIAMMLFVTVWMIFFLFVATAPNVQQKTFLISGMVFLLLTALTGILYVSMYLYPFLDPYREPLLVLHAMVSLYGWNLSGLFIIIRWNDFPIRLNSVLAIALHWSIVLVLAPLGKYVLPIAALAMAAYVALLTVVLAGGANHEEASR
ncbi:MAG: hypothetical protein JRS35_10115 [Deltaproteobacteria bacterium]|nr:hypothetical protein [Deltaproteobacteria bacterium]